MTMVPNKERRSGNISTLMCYFWKGVLVCLGSGWDCEALNRGIPAAEPVCDKLSLRWHVWRPTATRDAEPSAEQTGSCWWAFPVSDTLRQTGATFRFTKVEMEKIRAQTAAQSNPHANSPLPQPFVYCIAYPPWYFRRSKAADLPWLFLEASFNSCGPFVCVYESGAWHRYFLLFPACI